MVPGLAPGAQPPGGQVGEHLADYLKHKHQRQHQPFLVEGKGAGYVSGGYLTCDFPIQHCSNALYSLNFLGGQAFCRPFTCEGERIKYRK